jgi:hypothetical protein
MKWRDDISLKKWIFINIIDIPIYIVLCTMVTNILSRSGTFQTHCISQNHGLRLLLYWRGVPLLYYSKRYFAENQVNNLKAKFKVIHNLNHEKHLLTTSQREPLTRHFWFTFLNSINESSILKTFKPGEIVLFFIFVRKLNYFYGP